VSELRYLQGVDARQQRGEEYSPEVEREDPDRQE
jgi:hypothetical protein